VLLVFIASVDLQNPEAGWLLTRTFRDTRLRRFL
jgi:hypothetical protein